MAENTDTVAGAKPKATPAEDHVVGLARTLTDAVVEAIAAGDAESARAAIGKLARIIETIPSLPVRSTSDGLPKG